MDETQQKQIYPSLWQAGFDARQDDEIAFAKMYAQHFHHGTDGHNRLLLIDQMANVLDSYQTGLAQACGVAESYGNSVDGAHHKQWVIDQMLRKLLGEEYDEWVKQYNARATQDDLAEWDCGIAP